MPLFPVMEHFYTLQGEGYHQGKACYFIRLAGCDVGCVWCDVKESWDKENSTNLSPEELLDIVLAHKAERIVITGGEPAMYDLTSLCSVFKKSNIKVHLETSGAHSIIGSFDWICLSPKKFKKPLKASLALAHEFKAIIFHKSDLNWIQQFLKDIPSSCHLFLQPEWSKQNQNLNLIVDYVKKHPKWQVSLQTHKYMNIR